MKTLIRNALGATVVNQYLPMGAANAKTFAEAILDGTYSIYESDLTQGTDNDLSCFDTQLQFRDSLTGKKGYFRFLAKSTVNPDEIQDAFMGKTIDGILIDEVVIIGFAPMAFA